ncbi:MAG: trehalose repressor [Merdibacter sp.]
MDTWDEAIGVVRRQGILDGLKESGIERPYVYLSDFSFAHACTQVERILDEHSIDALICSTDRQALGAYKVIRERGYRIPQDISIISFGGYDISELLTPQLTTVRFDTEYSGKCCARTILAHDPQRRSTADPVCQLHLYRRRKRLYLNRSPSDE